MKKYPIDHLSGYDQSHIHLDIMMAIQLLLAKTVFNMHYKSSETIMQIVMVAYNWGSYDLKHNSVMFFSGI